jgi:hypothetical protein
MKSDMEDKKWLDECPALKQVSPGNPFTVPSGYFEEMEQRVTSAVQLEQIKAGDKGFTVPENYFDELSANIQSRISFEELANAENTGFAVPEMYFEKLQEQINARVFVEEALGEQDEFTVPAGYFEQLNKNILNKTVTQDMVMRKGVVRKMFASGAFKYAAAACFAVIVGTGLLLMQPPAPVDHKDSFLHKQVQTISVSDIKSYLQEDVDANDTQHAVIDENAPVNSTNLSNALQQYNNGDTDSND